MKDFLDLLHTILAMLYCFLGSAAFLKYLMCEERRSSRSRPGKPRRARPPREAAAPQEEKAPAAEAGPLPTAEEARLPVHQEPQPMQNTAPAPVSVTYPKEPPPGAQLRSYEVANPGYKLTEGYSQLLQPSGYGVLRACRIDGVSCVYVQYALEDAGADLTRLGLLQVYDVYDQNGNRYGVLPKGRLWIRNLQPAVCSEYGDSLTLVSKGRLIAGLVDESTYNMRSF